MNHILKVEDPWYTYIATGRKKVEGRKYDSKYNVGDIITFVNGNYHFDVKIIGVRLYDSIRLYLESEGVDNILPEIYTIEEGLLIYHSFKNASGERAFSDEKVREAGGFMVLQLA